MVLISRQLLSKWRTWEFFSWCQLQQHSHFICILNSFKLVSLPNCTFLIVPYSNSRLTFRNSEYSSSPVSCPFLKFLLPNIGPQLLSSVSWKFSDQGRMQLVCFLECNMSGATPVLNRVLVFFSDIMSQSSPILLGFLVSNLLQLHSLTSWPFYLHL